MATLGREEEAPQPLAGLLVVDLSEWVAGPNCAKILADFGARVVKVERPGGDPARRLGPFPDDVPEPEASGLFLHLNTNKESIVVDPSRPDGAGIVRELASRADVLVESFRPGTLASWGIAPAELIAHNPRLVVTSVTPFGQTGPLSRLGDDRDRRLRDGRHERQWPGRP
jgi:crotonobetainyl-CoA:carnitine CoA-transferase CaiB-like acyl-CoA transferase